MSRTYRTVHDEVAFCNKCNKPLYCHVVGNYKLCNCEPETVEVIGYKNINFNVPIYETIRDTEGNFLGVIFKGYEDPIYQKYTYETSLPQSKYYRHNVKVPDGVEGYLFQNEGRKRYQKDRNKQYRAKSKQVLRNRNVDWEDMVFPRNRKEVDWDMY